MRVKRESNRDNEVSLREREREKITKNKKKRKKIMKIKTKRFGSIECN